MIEIQKNAAENTKMEQKHKKQSETFHSRVGAQKWNGNLLDGGVPFSATITDQLREMINNMHSMQW